MGGIKKGEKKRGERDEREEKNGKENGRGRV